MLERILRLVLTPGKIFFRYSRGLRMALQYHVAPAAHRHLVQFDGVVGEAPESVRKREVTSAEHFWRSRPAGEPPALPRKVALFSRFQPLSPALGGSKLHVQFGGEFYGQMFFQF